MPFALGGADIGHRGEDVNERWYDRWHGFLLRIVTTTSLSYRKNPLPLFENE